MTRLDFARSALECGGTSHRFGTRDYRVEAASRKMPILCSCTFLKAAAGAAALQSASRETVANASKRSNVQTETTKHFARSALDCGGASHSFGARDYRVEAASQKMPILCSCAFLKAAAGAAALQSASRETVANARRSASKRSNVRTETTKHFARSALDCGGASHRFGARDSARHANAKPWIHRGEA
jgi:hypothetical protein